MWMHQLFSPFFKAKGVIVITYQQILPLSPPYFPSPSFPICQRHAARRCYVRAMPRRRVYFFFGGWVVGWVRGWGGGAINTWCTNHHMLWMCFKMLAGKSSSVLYPCVKMVVVTPRYPYTPRLSGMLQLMILPACSPLPLPSPFTSLTQLSLYGRASWLRLDAGTRCVPDSQPLSQWLKCGPVSCGERAVSLWGDFHSVPLVIIRLKIGSEAVCSLVALVTAWARRLS